MAHARFGEASSPVCQIYLILSQIHPEFCRTLGTIGGFNPEGSDICLDSGTSGGI